MTHDAQELVSAHVYLLQPSRAEPPLITSHRWPRGEISLAQLVTFARQHWGKDVFVLHDGGLHTGANEIVVLLEARSNGPATPPGDDCFFPRLPHSRPWQRPGWHAAALAWLDDRLTARGDARRGEVAQISTYDRACVIKAAHGERSVFLKAAEGRTEAATLAVLKPLLPGCLPELLGVREEDGLFATRDAGPHLSESDDLELWRDAVEKLARFHRDIDPGVLAPLGAPRHDFAALPARVSALLHDDMALEGWGLQPDTVAKLGTLAPTVEAAHARVDALGLAPTLTHGDSHPMNALTSPDGVVWFDWSEAGTAHPLLDAGWFFAWLSHPARRELPLRRAAPDAPERLWSHYLRALGAPEAAAMHDDAILLALAHRAASFAERFRDWQGTVAGWRPQYAPYYLNWMARLSVEAAVPVRLP